MGDPICKWRNASVWTTVELVSRMPKEEMSDADFRRIMNRSSYGPSFIKTAYQLACQLGLYYVDEQNIYHPRFNHDITNDEAKDYLKYWVTQYYVPNPYTARKFENSNHSLRLVDAIANLVMEHPNCANLEEACNMLFGEKTGNLPNVKYFINEYSDVMSIAENLDVRLRRREYKNCDVYNERNDKKAFFETFSR